MTKIGQNVNLATIGCSTLGVYFKRLNDHQSPENLTDESLNVALYYKIKSYPIGFKLCT